MNLLKYSSRIIYKIDLKTKDWFWLIDNWKKLAINVFARIVFKTKSG